jgi:AmmeMemoRadiSam system protein B
VAGYFYPEGERELRKMIEEMVDPEADKQKAICVISPHAGYVYSGKVAASVFSSVLLPDKFIIIGPNHGDVPTRMALVKEGIWQTPLGDVPIDSSLAQLLLDQNEDIREDEKSHAQEHSLEVQIPFIQYFRDDFSIVPISIAYTASYKDLVKLGESISRSIQNYGRDVLIVASTDMSHYVSQEEAREKDFLAIDKMLKMDAEGLYGVVRKERISMCGYQPVTAALVASKKLQAKKAELIKYQTSGDVSGDFLRVVGYAGIRII